ncbi:hypothetical protein SAMN02746093_02793 [Legionella quinlivanii DSM 21216]|nr:hypothetical protein SAMN02746093_02793 [Legionella quinlivanii DSM 21216]STY09955.1 Uncharacterised protein [Legionella quinlivanii]
MIKILFLTTMGAKRFSKIYFLDKMLFYLSIGAQNVHRDGLFCISGPLLF